jgi:hypothetical protein
MKTKILIVCRSLFKPIVLDNLPYIPRKGEVFFLCPKTYPKEVRFMQYLNWYTMKVEAVEYRLGEGLLEITICLKSDSD